jgi:cytochrome P450
VTSSDLDLADRANQQDPFPIYARLRDHDPAHWSARMKMWVVTRWDDVSRILQDPTRFSSDRFRKIRSEFATRRPDIEDVARILRDWAVYRDPPDHTRVRGLLNKAFTPRAVETMQPRIQQVVDDLLDRVAPRGTMDFIGDFAFPLPAAVIGAMLGVPTEDLPRLKTWSDEIAAYIGGAQRGRDNIRTAGQGLASVVEYFRDLIRARDASPKNDLVSVMLAAEDRGDMLSQEEVVSNCVLLLFAGHETTTDLLGNGLFHLLRRREDEALRRNPALVAGAIEEILRFDAPVAGKIKVAATGVELHGRRIAEGDSIAIMLASANRDPRQFPDADEFVITRDVRHLAFGQGIHFCLGAALARLEALIAFTTLFRRFGRLELADDRPSWKPQIFFRGLTTLPVAFG